MRAAVPGDSIPASSLLMKPFHLTAAPAVSPWTGRLVDRLVDVLVDEPAIRFVFRLVG